MFAGEKAPAAGGKTSSELIHMEVHMYECTYIYIYIYIERERTYIYIYRERERERERYMLHKKKYQLYRESKK